MEQHDEECRSCRFWIPTFYNLGVCNREAEPNSKLFTVGGDDPKLMTAGSFLCLEYAKVIETKEETI